MAEHPDSQIEAAREAWRLLFETFMAGLPQRTSSLARRELTPNDSRALFSLKRSEGQPIGALAKLWACDPSTATWVVDRLERAKLATRTASASDRRVKLVTLTAKGEKTRQALLGEFHEPPEIVFRLNEAELRKLRDLLAKLV